MTHQLHNRTLMLRLCLTCAALLILCSGAAQTARADAFTVTVNTTTISNQSGFLDLQFNPGNTTSRPSTAVVTNFTSNGTLGGATTTGAVSGTLPSTVTLQNSTQFNDLFQAFRFGTSFSFNVNLSVTNPGSTGAMTEFALSLFGSDGVTPLLTSDIDGRLLSIQLNPNGTTRVSTFGSSSNVITVTPQASTATPEPATLVLLGTGLTGVAAMARRRRKSCDGK